MQRLQRIKDAVLGPLIYVGTAYGSAAQKHPFLVGVITSGLKTSAADLFAQKVMEKREKIDWTRQAAFTFFGFTYLGAFQYFFYTRVLTPWARPITNTMGHIASAPFKTFLDQAIHHPFIYFPAFYALKYVIVKGEPASSAYQKYQDELWTNCQALWTIWVPSQLLNFSVVPAHLQIPYCAMISFVWTVVLSMMRGAFDDMQDAEQSVEAVHAETHTIRTSDTTETVAAQGCTDDLPSSRHALMTPSVREARPAIWDSIVGAESSSRPNNVKATALAHAAASSRSGIMALQHPLFRQTDRVAQMCSWDILSRMRRRATMPPSAMALVA